MAVLDKSFIKHFHRDENNEEKLSYEYNGVKFDIDEGLDEFGKPMMAIDCPDKRSKPIHIVKSRGGSSLFELKVEKSSVPVALAGKYTTIEDAMTVTMQYLAASRHTQGSKRRAKLEKA
jgi:hypothetical protein